MGFIFCVFVSLDWFSERPDLCYQGHEQANTSVLGITAAFMNIAEGDKKLSRALKKTILRLPVRIDPRS